MPIGITRTLSTGSIPYWQGTDDDIQLAQGGFNLDITGLIVGAVLPPGTPMIYNEATRQAKPITVGVIYENAASNAVAYKVQKGTRYKIGDYFAKTIGGAAYAITAIDTTNAAYDIITVGTTIGAATAGDFVYASTATGASAGAFGGVNGLLYEERTVDVGKSCSVVIRGTAYARRVPYSADLDTALRAANCHIIYSQSY